MFRSALERVVVEATEGVASTGTMRGDCGKISAVVIKLFVRREERGTTGGESLLFCRKRLGEDGVVVLEVSMFA